jgi:hypothetical protein
MRNGCTDPRFLCWIFTFSVCANELQLHLLLRMNLAHNLLYFCCYLNILDLGTSWRWMVSFTPQLLNSVGKSPWYPLTRRPGGSHNRPELHGKFKILDTTRTRNPTPRSSSLLLAAKPTVLPRFYFNFIALNKIPTFIVGVSTEFFNFLM